MPKENVGQALLIISQPKKAEQKNESQSLFSILTRKQNAIQIPR